MGKVKNTIKSTVKKYEKDRINLQYFNSATQYYEPSLK